MKVVAAVLAFMYVIDTRGGEPPRYFTGDARTDFFPILGMANVLDPPGVVRIDTALLDPVPSEKSPWIAGGLSLALPGAGEFYAESYWKSVAFFAAEVAAWIVAASYDSKGNRQTNLFQGFADSYWSVVSYATWLNANHGANIGISPDASLPPWERVDWIQLNYAERDTMPDGGTWYGFTHALPPHGEQQYYELIGKYDQYSPGWNDYAGAVDGNGLPIPTSNFHDYAAMRGTANDYYSIASTAVSIVIVNHVLSAIDAFFTASSFNKSIHADARMNLRHTPFGPVAESVATVRVTF